MDSAVILEWFNYGDSDFISANWLTKNHPVHIELVCYLCQQSAEKYLKGYLIFKGVEDPPKIHNLDTLCEMCEKYDEKFAEIKKPCNILTIYGVQPRYPDEMEIFEQDMKKALAYAEQMKAFEPLQAVRNELIEKHKKRGCEPHGI
ncbi:MAG: HEPN domain-containing protein [Oscillospiraceae bacterium]|nr:HEPN domain-containing protein [Oscillospiraceae bacterium]